MSENHKKILNIFRYFCCLFLFLIITFNSALALPSWDELKGGMYGLTNTAEKSGFEGDSSAPENIRITRKCGRSAYECRGYL